MKKAYYLVARVHHPDKKGNTKEATAYFQEIQHAYEVLSDDKKKYEYDNGRNIVLNNQNPFDIFSHMFNDRNIFNNNEFNININNFSNTSIATSINTTTRIIGNKKIIRTEKTEKTANGIQTTVEEKIETI